MKKKILIALAAVALVGCEQFSAQPALPANTVEAQAPANHFETITRIVDGDTVEIDARWSPYNLTWRVRMRGIDTPEKGTRARCTRERELSARAQALTEQLTAQTLNRVRLRNVDHDKYGGRLDADIIMADGRNMAEELLRAGLARRYNGNGPRPNWC